MDRIMKILNRCESEEAYFTTDEELEYSDECNAREEDGQRENDHGHTFAEKSESIPIIHYSRKISHSDKSPTPTSSAELQEEHNIEVFSAATGTSQAEVSGNSTMDRNQTDHTRLSGVQLSKLSGQHKAICHSNYQPLPRLTNDAKKTPNIRPNTAVPEPNSTDSSSTVISPANKISSSDENEVPHSSPLFQECISYYEELCDQLTKEKGQLEADKEHIKQDISNLQAEIQENKHSVKSLQGTIERLKKPRGQLRSLMSEKVQCRDNTFKMKESSMADVKVEKYNPNSSPQCKNNENGIRPRFQASEIVKAQKNEKPIIGKAKIVKRQIHDANNSTEDSKVTFAEEVQVYPHKRSSDKCFDSKMQINQKIASIQEKLIKANEKSNLAECKLHEAEKRAEKAEKELCFFREETKDIKQKIYLLYEENKSQKLKLEKSVLTADMKVSKMASEIKSELADRAEKKLVNASNKATMVEVLQTRARKAEDELYNANRKAEKELTDAGEKIAKLEKELTEFQMRTKKAEEKLDLANTKAKNVCSKLASQAEDASVQTTPSALCKVKLEDENINIGKTDNALLEKLRKAAITIQSKKDMAEMLEDKQVMLKKTLVQANRQSGDALAKLQTAERLIVEMKQRHPSTHHTATTLDYKIINGEINHLRSRLKELVSENITLKEQRKLSKTKERKRKRKIDTLNKELEDQVLHDSIDQDREYNPSGKHAHKATWQDHAELQSTSSQTESDDQQEEVYPEQQCNQIHATKTTFVSNLKNIKQSADQDDDGKHFKWSPPPHEQLRKQKLPYTGMVEKRIKQKLVSKLSHKIGKDFMKVRSIEEWLGNSVKTENRSKVISETSNKIKRLSRHFQPQHNASWRARDTQY